MGIDVVVYSGGGMTLVERIEHVMTFEYREIDGQGSGGGD